MPDSSGAVRYNIDDVTTAVVPLPGALVLFATGLLGLGAWGRKRKAA